MKNCYYVYLHINIEKNEIFYVGKGKGNRAYCSKKRNKHWTNIVNKYDYDILIIEDNLSEDVALEREKFYIKKIGRKDLGEGTLVNMNDGGSGFDSNKPPWNKGLKNPYTEDQLSKMRVNKRKYTDEEKDMRSKIMKGKNTWMLGKKHKKETIDKMKGRIPWNKGLKSAQERDKNGRFIKKNN